MASDGKIIIDTKLDTSGFEKDVDTASKKVVDSMGKIEKSVKKASTAFDGSKIANQLNNVSKSIDNTNKKLDLETQKLAKLKDAYSSAMNPTQQNKLQEQIVNTESKITSLEGRLNKLKDKQINLTAKVNTESIDKAVASIDKVGSSISSAGNSLSTKVTLPIAAAFGVAAKEAGDFEHQMADVAKEVKAKGEDVNTVMSQMASNSIKWSEDYGQSTDDINKGLLVLVKDGYSGAESMEIMNTALKTARGANEDLFTTIDKLGGSLEAYQMKSDNAATTTANMAHMADTFAYISNHTKASIDSLGEAFSTVGQTASALGIPMEQTAAAIGVLESSNIDASTAATSLKAGLVNLTKPTKQMKKGMEELGISAFDSNGKMKDLSTIINDIQKGSKGLTDQQKEAAIAMTFGKESLASWTTLVNKGGDYLKNLADSAGNATGEVQELSDSMKDTPVNKMKEAEASFKALGITFGEEVLPEVMPLVQELTNMLKSFSELDEGTKKQIINWALFAAAVGPVLKVTGSLTGGIGSLVKFGGKLATTFGLLGEGTELGGAALTGFSVAGMAAAGAATALVAGVAGVITYNELMNRSVATSTDDLNGWEKAVNAVTGGTIKSKEELQKAGLVYKDFGDGVSDSFKNGIDEANKSYKDFQNTLTLSNIDDKITDANQGKISGSINSMIDNAKKVVDSRKSELQSQLSQMFTLDDGTITEDEQKVLDTVSSESDAKMIKLNELQTEISNIWTKAIEEHGKLSDEDVKNIEHYVQEVQQIQAEAKAKNDAESNYAKNLFGEKLNGMSAEDATKEYQGAQKDIEDRFAKLKATYKTGIEDLQQVEAQAENDGNQSQVDAVKKQIEEKTKAYEEATGKQQSQVREYLNELYSKNPELEGKLNEVTGEMFSSEDKYVQGHLYNLKQEFSQISDVTQSGMIRVQDSIGKWHDIYVTVDQATGDITSAYDTFTGQFGGYSKKFEDQAKETGDKVKQQMQTLAANLQYGISSLKLDGNNEVISVKTDGTEQAVAKLDTVINKLDGTKVAITNVNGTELKIEFNKDGTISNIDDILAAIQGKTKDNPAVVDVDVNNQEAMQKFQDTENKVNDINGNNPSIDITVNSDNAFSDLTSLKNKLDGLPREKQVDIIVNQTANLVEGAIKSIGTPNSYTGTNSRKGLSHVNEHKYETANDNNVLMLAPGLAYIASHYSGGDGINDHMTTVDEMHNDITNQVNGSIGAIINTLISAMTGQATLLKGISNNTANTVVENQKGNQLNEKLATSMMDTLKSQTTGNFSGLQSEINSANAAKTKADNMKVEDNYWYSSSKAQLDDVDKQLQDMQNQSNALEAGKQESFDKSTNKAVSDYNKQIEVQKKEIEAQENALKIQKQDLQDSVDYYKDAAQKEIETVKAQADQEVKIAEDKKDKLTKLSEAVTTAIKNQLSEQETAAENSINSQLTTLENTYNKKVAALEQQSTDTSREDTINSANKNIDFLKNEMNNTASYADRQALALKIKDAKGDLQKQQDEWEIEDKKKALEDEYNTQKESLEKQLQDTKDYYSKLQDEDSINAQARYALLNDNSTQLVNLLNSYNPQWQDAGQSLADSLINGLNSQQQSVQDAVNDLVSLRGASQSYYYNEKGQKVSYSTGQVISGYATGTNYNPQAGLYNVDEGDKFEIADSDNAVAYVSQGAAIKNHMQSEQFIKSEISKQVAAMKASVMAQQYQMKSLLTGALNGNTNNITNNNRKKLSVNVANLNLNTGQDVEAFSNEMGYYAFRQKVN
ncbi:phage tail tape measure protein [uncultured Clostridium sp.]|uniref:phage tail tape measure protein n=1 Tax=uncultured Clostridium sp. TaxID=59620 RepID=UPI0028E7CDB2|nr:phage tail tape measure protein [uncultured Clostridium sp.]